MNKEIGLSRVGKKKEGTRVHLTQLLFFLIGQRDRVLPIYAGLPLTTHCKCFRTLLLSMALCAAQKMPSEALQNGNGDKKNVLGTLF